MPLEAPLPPIRERVAELNRRYRHHSAAAVLEHALNDPLVGPVALVSSFGAESVVLLHLVSTIDRSLPVIFLDTEMLFPETLAYQRAVSERLGLGDVRVIRPDREALFARDPDALLYRSDPDACCALRKSEPLARALEGFDAWITGRKRFQGKARAALELFEDEGGRRIKINPLAHWSPRDVQDYIVNNRLPRHPLVGRGYPSIGCRVCTTPAGESEPPRAGRWRGSDKEECGIHFLGGKAVPGPAPKTVIVTDTGFASDDWTGPWLTPEALERAGRGAALDIGPETDLGQLAGHLEALAMIRVNFPAFSDGRGFTIARQLRRMGYRGRLRAGGHLIADQYAMARRSGFDEVEIAADLAERQPQEHWLARADWQQRDYQSRLREGF